MKTQVAIRGAGPAGLRYTDNSRDAAYFNATPFGAGPPVAFIVPPGTASTNFLCGSGPGSKNIRSQLSGRTAERVSPERYQPDLQIW